MKTRMTAIMHMVLQIAKQLVDEDRLVLREGDAACLPAAP